MYRRVTPITFPELCMVSLRMASKSTLNSVCSRLPSAEPSCTLSMVGSCATTWALDCTAGLLTRTDLSALEESPISASSP